MQLTSAPLVAWGNAWLTGHVGLDDAVDAVERRSGPNLIGTVPASDLPFDSDVPLRAALTQLRGLGLSAFRLALPTWGDPLGLVGPKELNQAAIEAGEGVLVQLADQQVGLVPSTDRRGSSYVGVSWTPYLAEDTRPQVPSLPEAESEMKVTLMHVTQALEKVDDVASFAPAVHRELGDMGSQGAPPLAHGYPPRAHRVATQAERLAKVVRLADPSGARGLNSHQMNTRLDALRRLDAAVRRAMIAAHAAVLQPRRRE